MAQISRLSKKSSKFRCRPYSAPGSPEIVDAKLSNIIRLTSPVNIHSTSDKPYYVRQPAVHQDQQRTHQPRVRPSSAPNSLTNDHCPRCKNMSQNNIKSTSNSSNYLSHLITQHNRLEESQRKRKTVVQKRFYSVSKPWRLHQNLNNQTRKRVTMKLAHRRPLQQHSRRCTLKLCLGKTIIFNSHKLHSRKV